MEKNNKLDFIKIKKFCASMDTIKKVERKPAKWKKIFVDHTYIDKELVHAEYIKNSYNSIKDK